MAGTHGAVNGGGGGGSGPWGSGGGDGRALHILPPDRHVPRGKEAPGFRPAPRVYCPYCRVTCFKPLLLTLYGIL